MKVFVNNNNNISLIYNKTFYHQYNNIFNTFIYLKYIRLATLNNILEI